MWYVPGVCLHSYDCVQMASPTVHRFVKESTVDSGLSGNKYWERAAVVLSMLEDCAVWQISRTSDLLILSSLEESPGKKHTAGGGWIAERENQGKRKMPFEGGVIGRVKWSGRERYTGYNLNHMADLKRLTLPPLIFIFSIIALMLLHVMKPILNNINISFHII